MAGRRLEGRGTRLYPFAIGFQLGNDYSPRVTVSARLSSTFSLPFSRRDVVESLAKRLVLSPVKSGEERGSEFL